MTSRNWWRRGFKIAHEIAAIGVGGALVSCLVIDLTTQDTTSDHFIAARLIVAAIARYVLIPSLAIVLVSGLLAIAATRGFHDAGWAWVKAALGLSVFEATLVTVGATRTQAELAATATDPAVLSGLLHSERNTLWLLIVLSVVNVVLAVWRPKLGWKVK